MSTHSTTTVFIADDFENRNRVDLGDIHASPSKCDSRCSENQGVLTAA